MARPFASHLITLQPGGLVWQPHLLEDQQQPAWSKVSSMVHIHILNAKQLRAWTGIDPPQSLVDPELYTTVGVPFIPSDEEAEELVRQNVALYDQLCEHVYGRRNSASHTDGRSTVPKDSNPFTAIKFRHFENVADSERSGPVSGVSSNTSATGQTNLVNNRESGVKGHWWTKFFRSKE